LVSTEESTAEIIQQPVILDQNQVPASVLDIQAGISQLAGNTNLYIKLLTTFAKQIETSFFKVADLLDALEADSTAGAFDEVQELNHALKGVAGNLAAKTLFETSAQIDLLLKAQQCPSPEQRDALRQAFSQTQALIEAYLSEQNVMGEAYVPTGGDALDLDILSCIQQLKPRIEASEYIDDQALDQLAKGLPLRLQPSWQAFISALDAFDFDTALAHLDDLMTDLKQS
jgi:HPt (histidine-containing phosphotransfer) domain-containing protein